MSGTNENERGERGKDMPLLVRRFELYGTLSAGGTATAKLRKAVGGTLTTTDSTFTVWSEFITGTIGKKGYAVFMHDMKRWEVVQLEC